MSNQFDDLYFQLFNLAQAGSDDFLPQYNQYQEELRSTGQHDVPELELIWRRAQGKIPAMDVYQAVEALRQGDLHEGVRLLDGE